MISIKNLEGMLSREKLQAACQSMAVLDAILSQDWVYRYYSYNSEWSENEQFFEMRNGQGSQLLFLFNPFGCVINGFCSESENSDEQKVKATHGLPEIYHEFIYGEPVNSIGTTFCLWTNEDGIWVTGNNNSTDDISEELLSPFDGQPESYLNWATVYFAEGYNESGIPLKTVASIFNHEPLTKEMILSITGTLEDWEQLEEDLEEISYPYHKTQ